MQEKIQKKYLWIQKETVSHIKTLLDDINIQKNKELEAEIEQLKNELKEIKKLKKYWLVWEEKQEFFDKETIWKLPVLKEIKENDIFNNDNESNILIEWDNYHTLSVLNYTHKWKIDVIYIDPFYNTWKQDFIYNDNYVDKEDKFKHSKWLSFMNKRLRLANNLLSDDWIIFMSIDDNEYSQLKILSDEIFWAENYLDTFHIQVRYANKSLNEKDDFQKLIEYTLIYSKNKFLFSANKEKEKYSIKWFKLDIKHNKKPDKVFEKNWRKVEVWDKDSFSIKKTDANLDSFKETWISWSILSWTWHWTTYLNYIDYRRNLDWNWCLYRIYWIWEDWLWYRYYTNPKNESAERWKMYSKIPSTKLDLIKKWKLFKEKPIINFYDYSADFWNIRHEWDISFNSWKKPVKFLKNLINIHKGKNTQILDFFAWSWSTWHAVLELNKEDWWNRKFILSTNNENNICEEITYKRLKNVIKWYKKYKWFGWNLKYLKTDFIDKHKSNDDLKIRMVNRCSELLCLKENIWEEVSQKNKKIKLYKRNDKYLAILYDMFYFDEFKKVLSSLDKQVSIYAFSHYKLLKEDFEDIWVSFEIEDIPDPILEVYDTIFWL